MQSDITVWSGRFELGDTEFSHITTNVIMRKLFQTIAENVNARPEAHIGHIKGFCSGIKTDFLKISFVSASGGVDFSGTWRHKPDTAELGLNVIVLGFPRKDLIKVIHGAIKKIEPFCTVNTVAEPDRSPFLVIT